MSPCKNARKLTNCIQLPNGDDNDDDDLLFYVPFNTVKSHIETTEERPCIMKRRTVKSGISSPAGLEHGIS